jgi:hypothetical protein
MRNCPSAEIIDAGSRQSSKFVCPHQNRLILPEPAYPVHAGKGPEYGCACTCAVSPLRPLWIFTVSITDRHRKWHERISDAKT